MSEILVNGKPISSLRVVDLKEELERRGLSKNGRKDELLLRLQSFLEVNPEETGGGANEDGRNDGEDTDVIEASRLEAERRRHEEEQRQLKRKEEECARREQEEEARRAEAERQRIAEEEKQRLAEEEARKAEQDRLLREQEEQRRAEEELRKAKAQEEERKREEQKRVEEEKQRKEEERRLEEERQKKEVQRRLEEEKRKLEAERIEEERRKKEEQEQLDREKRRKEEQKKKEEEKRLQEEENRKMEEKQRLNEEKKRQEEEAEREQRLKENPKEDKTNDEDKLKEKLLQRLMQDKKGNQEEEEKEGQSEKGGGEEGGGDDTLVMEIDQNDLVTDDSIREKKESESPLKVAKPGDVKPLRRLGSKSSTGESGEKRKRGWGASSSTTISPSKNIDISSNLLKDIVPDPSNLLSKPVAIEEEEEKEGEDKKENNHLKNGHKNGNNSDDEIGPSLPKERKMSDKSTRKEIVFEEDSLEETDVILILNLARPFTPHQLKEMLKRTGTIRDFWLNKIKSKCCVRFSSVAEASETRMHLNGLTWPVDNRNTLHVVFTTPDNMERLKSSAEEAADRMVISNGARGGIPVREWDKDRLGGGSRGGREERQRSASRDLPARPAQTKSLEELFNKTKTTPALYWKPLSAEVIAKKEEARNRRVLAAQKKRSRSRSRS